MEAEFAVRLLVPLVALLSYALLLVMVLRRTVRSRMYRLFSLHLSVMAVWSFGSSMMHLDPGRVPFWSRVLVGAALFMPLSYFAFVQAFLDERRDRWLWVGMVGVVGLEVANVLGFLPMEDRLLWRGSFTSAAGLAVVLAAIFGALLWGFSCWSLVRAYYHTPVRTMRGRIRLLFVGLLFVGLGVWGGTMVGPSALTVADVANLASAMLLAYAIIRYQIVDITIEVRSGLVYSLATAVIGAGYFVTVFLVVGRYRLVSGYQVLALSLLLAAVTAVAFEPLRNRIQSGVDRVFFRDRHSASLMLERLSRTAASVLDLDRLTCLILDEIAATMHVEKAAFLFRERGRSGDFRLMVQRGLDRETASNWRGTHPIIVMLSSRKEILTRRQLEVLPQFETFDDEELADLDRMQAELFVPLLVRDELIGIFVLGSKPSAAPYSSDEQRILTTVANQSAVAIENAYLFSLEQHKAEELSALLAIARAVSSTMDLPRVLEIVSQRTAEVCEVDGCTILLLDDQESRLVPLISETDDAVTTTDVWLALAETGYEEVVDRVPLIRRLVEEHQPVILDEESVSYLPGAWVELCAIKSLLVVPLVGKGKLVGVMVLNHTEEGRHFTGEQINLATTIGTQASIAIENARLYAETIEEKERTETILAQAVAGIMVVDAATRIVALNPEVEAISGYASDELLGTRLGAIFGPQLSGPGSLLSSVMETGERVEPTEATLVGKHGARDILLGIALLGEDYLLNFADITRLKEADRLKTSIVANVSHELRAPLASIKAYTELLLGNLEGEDRALRHRFLSIIDQEADWLTELINDLLDLSRLESEQYSPRLDLLSVNEIIDGVTSLLDVQIQKRGMIVNLDVPADLPLILADKELLTITIKNVLSNAVKFSLEGGPVDLKARKVGDNLVLKIADRGIGIPAEDLPHLFTKFYRSEAAMEAGIRGTGLGLALTREAVEVHGGTIEVESEPDVGTTITVILPLLAETRMDGLGSREWIND